MKEKIKKFFKGITPDLVLAWFNLGMFGYFVFLAVSASSYVVFTLSLPFLLIAFLAFDLHKTRKELNEAKTIAVLSSLAGMQVSNKLKRYKKLYGELPSEESSEQEKKEENERKNE